MTNNPRTRENSEIPARAARPLAWGFLGSGLATGASYWAPETHSSTLVGLIFLSLAAYLVRDAPLGLSESGLAFGGLFDRSPLSSRRLARESGRALLVALVVAVLVFPPFTIGYVLWFAPNESFSLERALGFGGPSAPLLVLDLILAHLLVVALPEEVFFRGYLQSSLARALDAEHGPRAFLPNLITSSLFALGHFATDPVPSRLAVFFPSLLFGLLRQRTGGVGASIFIHALSNLYSAFLAAGFGFAG